MLVGSGGAQSAAICPPELMSVDRADEHKISGVIHCRLLGIGDPEIKKWQRVRRTTTVMKISGTEKLGQDLLLGTAPAFQAILPEFPATSFEFCAFQNTKLERGCRKSSKCKTVIGILGKKQENHEKHENPWCELGEPFLKTLPRLFFKNTVSKQKVCVCFFFLTHTSAAKTVF